MNSPRTASFLKSGTPFFVLWCMVASFGVYFCMYAFRKPFNVGLYSGLTLWGLGYKSVLILSQVFGYMLSKFMGIKVISELKPSARIKLIIFLILVAEVALTAFGLVPHPWNFIFLFINGLPLGMVYGVVFSFLEGRRVTEMIAMGLSVSIIIASGILKTVYIKVHSLFPGVSEFWMPALMGLIFFFPFLLFVRMLAMIPPPDGKDLELRSQRLPMTSADKRKVLREFWFPVVGFIICYSLLATTRDFRDNFAVEIWNEIQPGWTGSVLATTEMLAGIVVLLFIGGLSFIRDNRLGFRMTNLITFAGLAISGVATILFAKDLLSPYVWMLLIGIGMFLSYTAIQTVVFERMIALFRIQANAGFFMYLCDSIGYFGSVALLLFKEFFMQDIRWSATLIRFIGVQSAVGLVLLVAVNIYFHRRARRETSAAINNNTLN